MSSDDDSSQDLPKRQPITLLHRITRWISFIVIGLIGANLIQSFIQSYITNGNLPDLNQLQQIYVFQLIIGHPVVFTPLIVLALIGLIIRPFYEQRLEENKEAIRKAEMMREQEKLAQKYQAIMAEQFREFMGEQGSVFDKHVIDIRDRYNKRIKTLLISTVTLIIVTIGIFIHQGIILHPVSTLMATPIPKSQSYPNVVVNANVPWEDTSIRVAIGDSLTITYEKGSWTSDPNLPLTEADGYTLPSTGKSFGGDPTCDNCGEPLPTSSTNAMVGRIGNGSPFLVGNHYSSTVVQAGNLMLEINDNPSKFQDNVGSVSVLIIIMHKIE